MANNFESNITRKLMRVFLEKFESKRVLSKNVNTQLLSNAFNTSTGDTVFFKRPTDYVAVRNATGDLTSSTASDIITGKASGVVQDYITVHVDYDEAAEAIEMDQIDQLLDPMATRVVTTLELDYADFMMKNSGLLAGAPGTAVTTWDHVAEAGAVMQAAGIPMDDEWMYSVNPFTQRRLASDQRSLGSGGVSGSLISEAHKRAIITENFAGFSKVMTATTLSSFTTPTTGDVSGLVNGAPTPTYLAAKDTMTQAVTVDAFGTFTGTIKAGTVVQFTAINRLNMSTRQPIIDDTGANRLFTAVVTVDASLTSGAGTLIISGPGIFEANGAFNTIESAILNDGIITILNADATLFQPNLFWHKQAFSIGSVPIKKLNSLDTLGTTEDGLQLRISKGSDFIKNSQQIRIDFRPSYAVLNPFFAGQGFG